MANSDTIKLLKECNAGVKMAVSSMDEVMNSVKDDRLKQMLEKNKLEHQELGNRTHSLLKQYGDEDKEPNAFAKGMSYVKTNVKLGMHDNDHTVADLVTDGCNMGVKSLCRYLNQYPAADQESKSITKKLISIEDHLSNELRSYL